MKDEALKLAKAWFERNTYADEAVEVYEAIEQALAAPVQEPESFEQWNAKQHADPEEIGFLQALRIAYCAGQDSVTKATPPAAQRQWVGLTAAEVDRCWNMTPMDTRNSRHMFAYSIEAKLKEKNT